MMNAKYVLAMAVVALVTTVLLRWTLISGADEVQATRVHGEQVFRLQNAVVSRLIDAGESGKVYSARESAALRAAEDRIVNDCRHLNEAASLSASGGGPDASLQMRVMDSLDNCETAALDIGSQMDDGRAALPLFLP